MTFVATMTTDAGAVENPTWRDVEKAIEGLNAKTLTLLVLAPSAPLGPPDGDQHMAIGGGKDGRYVVYCTEDNLIFWNLEKTEESTSEQQVLMVIGGQEGEYREAQCVPKHWATRAAHEYFEHGRRASDLPWKHGQ